MSRAAQPTRKVTRLAPGVVSDPCIGCGAPTADRTRVKTATIFGRFLGGETILSLLLDYEMYEHEVENAIRYEIARRLRLKGWLRKAQA